MTGRRQALKIVATCLQSAAGGDAAAVERRAVGDWTPVVALANAHLLAPALYRNLADADRLDDVPSDVRDYLALLHRLNGDRNEALRRQIIELVAALNVIGVVPMLLKGGLGLFVGLYADPAARMIRDIDILVPARQAECAAEALRRLGYGLIARYETGHNAYGDFARSYDAGAVDLHTELVETPYLLPASDVWRRARIAEAAPTVRFAAPDPTDRTLHHLLHAQIHYAANFYRGVLELQQLYEFARLVNDQRDIDWAAIERRLARHQLGIALESYALAAQRLFGGRWPLSNPPSRLAAAHCQRCLVQLRWPVLAWLATPVANVRAAFAWHRMDQLYSHRRTLAVRRFQHASQFIGKKSARAALARMFRA